MEIIIQSRGFTAGDDLENYIREKFDKLTREPGTFVRMLLCLSLLIQILADIIARPGWGFRNDHFVKTNGHTFETAIVDAVKTAQHAMRKAKEKQIDKNQGSLNLSVSKCPLGCITALQLTKIAALISGKELFGPYVVVSTYLDMNRIFSEVKS